MKIIELSRSGGDILAISKLILNGEVQMDVTSDTVTTGSMLSGTTATKNDGTKATGTIANKSSSDLTVSGATVTAPAGYYANAASKAVATTTHPNPTASIASSTGVVTASHTQTTGYVIAGTTTGTLNLTTQAATTYNTSTADQTIASNRWLTGVQTIKSVTTSNLTAENIAEGVVVKVGDANNASRITQITGTHSGETSYTATISGSGNSSYCYVSYNGTKYYTNGNTFTFKAGDTLTIYCRGNFLQINSERINLSNYTYTYTLPVGDINILFEYSSSTINDIGIDTFVMPVGTYNVSGWGGYNIYKYANIEVPQGSAFPPATTITKAPTFSMNSATGVVTASYTGSSSITPTVTSGYITAGTAGTISTTGTSTYQLTSKAAATYYPSTADQTISSYRWLTGAQTIKSVTTSNLTAENIVEGVVVKIGDSSNASRITQITGTYEGSNVNIRPLVVDPTSEQQIFDGSDDITYLNVSQHTSLQDYRIPITWNAIPSIGTTIHISGFSWELNTNYNQWWDTIDSVSITFNGFPISLTGSLEHEIIYIYENYIYLQTQMIDPVTSGYIDAFTIDGTVSVDAYFPITVNAAGGFTVDQIAMRTISGDISGSATSIGMYAFYSCKNLTTASFPSCTLIRASAFAFCSSLTTVSFPLCTSIQGSAFHSCATLTTASFPSCTSIGDNAFAHCYSLTTVNFPSCTSIEGYAFANCSSLTTMSFPLCLYIGSYAFRSCTRLTTASFPSCTSISMCAFSYCSSLTTANFPLCISIGGSAFYSCSRLTTASFPLCTSISTNVFAYCYRLTTVSFPSCTSIGASAFVYCYNLLSIYLLGSSVPFLSSNAFYSTPIGGRTTSTGGVYGSIFVPASLYSSYLTATNWSVYSSRIVSV